MKSSTVVASAPSDDLGTPVAPRSAGAGARSAALDANDVARRALDIGRRTALGVLAGDSATADDVAQEVAIQAVRHVARLRDPQALDGWLYRTAVRAALRSARRGVRRRAIEREHAALNPAAVELSTASGTLDDLLRLLAGLPERQRAALTLRYVHDLDDAQIAAALGCRAGTVRALLSRGRTALRERLDDPRDPTRDETSPTPTTSHASPEGVDDVTDR